MIPRKIHYCWFGRGEKPRLAQKCIASWKKYCPDYEIIEPYAYMLLILSMLRRICRMHKSKGRASEF